MRHLRMICENHPHLNWMTKEIAITNGRYNQSRNIFFLGVVVDENGKNSIEKFSQIDASGKYIGECECSGNCLKYQYDPIFDEKEIK